MQPVRFNVGIFREPFCRGAVELPEKSLLACPPGVNTAAFLCPDFRVWRQCQPVVQLCTRETWTAALLINTLF